MKRIHLKVDKVPFKQEISKQNKVTGDYLEYSMTTFNVWKSLCKHCNNWFWIFSQLINIRQLILPFDSQIFYLQVFFLLDYRKI